MSTEQQPTQDDKDPLLQRVGIAFYGENGIAPHLLPSLLPHELKMPEQDYPNLFELIWNWLQHNLFQLKK